MTEQNRLYNSVAPLRNVAAIVSLIERVNSRQIGLPGMATFYGPSGFGKTTGLVYAANKFQAIQVQVKSCWTKKKLCSAILAEMGIDPAKTISDMVDQIARELALSDKALLVDEADFLVKQGMIEILRDIYESSETTVILVGEETLPQKLQKWERVHGRMMDWVAAMPACADDVEQLAHIYCPDVYLDVDFREHLLRQSQHSIRRVCINLSHAAELARIKGEDRLDMGIWGKRAFFSTSAPSPRRALA